MNALIEDKIPNQHTGAKTDNFASVSFSTVDEAKQMYNIAKSRLLNVNEWNRIAAGISATFTLTDQSGNQVNAIPEKGNYFQIDLPAPGTITGDGFDWVQVESVEETNDNNNEEVIAIRVRPASNPAKTNEDVAHFFTDEATSSFIVSRKGKTVTAEVHGRNEKANTEAESIIDKTRNALVAAGAKAGISSIQWKNLVNGLIGQTDNN